MTTLALPAKVETAIKPKPTKSEIISAMVRVKIEQHDAEQRAIAQKRASLGEEIEKALKAFAKTAARTIVPTISLGYSYGKGDYGNVSIRFEMNVDNLPPAIDSRLVAYHAIPKTTVNLDERKVRREITAKLEGIGTRDERIDALVDDPESRKGIEDMLKLIA